MMLRSIPHPKGRPSTESGVPSAGSGPSCFNQTRFLVGFVATDGQRLHLAWAIEMPIMARSSPNQPDSGIRFRLTFPKNRTD